MREDIKETIFTMNIDSIEYAFILDCLKAAVEYCKEQFESSDIDWLPAASNINLQDEIDKFELLNAFLQSLED